MQGSRRLVRLVYRAMNQEHDASLPRQDRSMHSSADEHSQDVSIDASPDVPVKMQNYLVVCTLQDTLQ